MSECGVALYVENLHVRLIPQTHQERVSIASFQLVSSDSLVCRSSACMMCACLAESCVALFILPYGPPCHIHVQPSHRTRQHNGAYSWGASPRLWISCRPSRLVVFVIVAVLSSNCPATHTCMYLATAVPRASFFCFFSCRMSTTRLWPTTRTANSPFARTHYHFTPLHTSPAYHTESIPLTIPHQKESASHVPPTNIIPEKHLCTGALPTLPSHSRHGTTFSPDSHGQPRASPDHPKHYWRN